MNDDKIKKKLSDAKSEIRKLGEFLQHLKRIVDSKNHFSKSRYIEMINGCLEKFNIISDNFRNPYKAFGYEVFLAELIEIFKKGEGLKKLNTNCVDESNFIEALDRLLSELELAISNSCCIAKVEQIISTSNTYISSSESEEISNFVAIGKELAKDDIMKKIVLELKELPKVAVSHFTSIVGPSFMGKTQAAFTLAHLVTVLYVNFTSIRATVQEQQIYEPFSAFSDIFAMAIESDINSTGFANTNRSATQFSGFNSPLKTVGLMYVLLRYKQISLEVTVNQWFQTLTSISSIVIPSMNIIEFHRSIQCFGLNLKECLIFIDELIPEDQAYSLKVQFLRNLCRFLSIPVIISSTSSHANNLIARNDSKSSGRRIYGRTKWVKVITKLPDSSLLSLVMVIKFLSQCSGSRNLKDFLSCTEGIYKLDCRAIAWEILGSDEFMRPACEILAKFIEFIVPLCLKTLPGIGRYSLEIFLNEMHNIGKGRFTPNHLWSRFITIVRDVMFSRKCNILKIDGLLASIHSMTFPCDMKRYNEQGGYCANYVNNHFFRYGFISDSIFDLFICPVASPPMSNSNLFNTARSVVAGKSFNRENENEQPVLKRQDNTEFEDTCYFPYIYDDILLNLGSWSCLKLEPNCTLASLYELFLERSNNCKINTLAISQDSFALELLAQWAICSATHGNLASRSSGKEVLSDFVKNVQSFSNISKSKVIKPIHLEFGQISDGLDKLLSRITFPYLIDGKFLDQGFLDRFRPYFEIGSSYLCESKDECDVIFDSHFDAEPRKGFLECKYLKEPIGLPSFLKYYKRACIERSPISILVCRELQKGIKSDKSWEKFNEEIVKKKKVDAALKKAEASIKKAEAEAKKGVKTESEKKNSTNIIKSLLKKTIPKDKETETDIFKLWQSPDNFINIYAIQFDYFSSTELSSGKFTVKTLKEFENPTGVFFLVESNFNPGPRTFFS